jgi:MoaA/NifB/PqqE/SkfB family radical SAM enzyme
MMLYRYEDVRVVHLEITEKCQATCPMCDRNMNGGADNPNLGLHELSLEDVQQIMPPEFVKQLDRIYMCGNFGDPIIAKDTLEVFQYFRSCKKELTLGMNTNAGAKKPEWWRELAKTLGNWSYLKFSFDGLGDTNHLYRQGVNWDIAWENALAFIEAGGKAEWDYLIFEHNEHQVEEARALAEKVGFRKFIPKKTGRFFSTMQIAGKEKHQAVNRKGEKQQLLAKPKEVKYQNKALDKIQELKEKHGSLENYFDNVEISCKVAAEKNMYLSAEGLVLPCCWVAGNMYKWWQKPGQNQVWELIQQSGGKDAFDAKKHGLRAVLENDYFSRNLVDSWGKPNTHMGTPLVCSQKCGKEFDAFKAQFQ